MKSLSAVFILALTTSAIAQNRPTRPSPFVNKENITLWTADALVRALDAESTRHNLTDPCRCFHETSLPGAIAGSTPRMYGYSFGVTGVVVVGSWVAHRTHHYRVERVIPMIDIGWDSRSVENNWRIRR